jgi:hypothetical protein
MDKAMREKLEKAGYRIGDYADFLGLTEEERELVELRLKTHLANREAQSSEGQDESRRTDS